jgi:ribosomal-protein-alanine N-acetyltransferase
LPPVAPGLRFVDFSDATAMTAADFPILGTRRLVLRPAKPEDTHAIVQFYQRNRVYFQPWEAKRSEEFFTGEFWMSEIERHRESRAQGKAYRFFLFQRSDPGQVVGLISLSQIFRGPFHAAYLGYALDERQVGKGLMFEGVSAVIRYAFDDLNLHRLMANYIPTNERSGRLLRRLGFMVEGYARDYLLINGGWRDHILASLTNDAWVEEGA